VLLAVAAVAAAASAAGAVPAAVGAAPAVALTEWWRAHGLVVSAGVFALLAAHPVRRVGLRLLAIGHELAMTATGSRARRPTAR
jgi:hypothetical protein